MIGARELSHDISDIEVVVADNFCTPGVTVVPVPEHVRVLHWFPDADIFAIYTTQDVRETFNLVKVPAGSVSGCLHPWTRLCNQGCWSRASSNPGAHWLMPVV